uniref:NADH-ubiquinone oxidoreductase chain 6 n=1 Tax=Chauliognathus opacus TaxID=528223 RepID=D1G5K6_CHAOP|nr:NADH dehydrogenase subunit 6 [Chauliognathus opacus]ACM45021.1 NADH dehydrogenase subunit 6 [Chauliognathus opacus]
MMEMITAVLITSVITFALCNHPLSMGLTLLVTTIFVALVGGLKSFNFWYSFILFMIMVGGMMILFIYMTSITSNEKFEMPYKMILSTFVLIMIMSYLLSENPMFSLQEMSNEEMNKNNILEISMNKYFIENSYQILLMLIIYLLVTLIAVVKITNISAGPLRKK